MSANSANVPRINNGRPVLADPPTRTEGFIDIYHQHLTTILVTSLILLIGIVRLDQ